MIYLIESCAVKLSKRNTNYVACILNDGVERKQVSIWGATETTGWKNAIMQVNLKEKDGFFSADLTECRITPYDTLPTESPIRKLRIKTNVSVDQTLAMFLEISDHCKFDPWVKDFLDYVNIRDILNLYGVYPGGLVVHHSIKGGLLEHVHEMLTMVKGFMDLPMYDAVCWEIVVIAILFHDYGKLQEYNLDEWSTNDSFYLKGHTFISASTVSNMIQGFNKTRNAITSRQKDFIIHCILAHHGEMEKGAPVNPTCVEAYLVSMFDEMSARVSMFRYTNEDDSNRYITGRVIKILKDFK